MGPDSQDLYPKFTVLQLLAVLLVLVVSECSKKDTKEDLFLKPLLEGMQNFSFKLYTNLSKEDNASFVVSPISLGIALGHMYSGSRGVTADELGDLLHLPDRPKDNLLRFKKFVTILGNHSVNIANGMFLDKTVPLKKEFQNNSQEFFASTASSVNFLVAAEQSRKFVNSWMSRKTKKRIPEILQQESVNNMTQLISVNGFHFKADWATQFDSNLTQLQNFTIDSNSQPVQIKMMRGKGRYGFLYDKESKSRTLVMDYHEGALQMAIVLPEKVDGLKDLEKYLATIDLPSRLKSIHYKSVTVTIPKFKVEKHLKLNEVLKHLGVKLLFDEEDGDLTGISYYPVLVSEIVQKVIVEVSEEGTKAAAGSASSIVQRTSLSQSQEELEPFIADHPFLFYVIFKHNQYRIPLIIGRYTGP